MGNKNLEWLLVLLVVALLGVGSAGAAVQAQTGGGNDLSWWTVDGGGEKIEGGGVSLVGTVGQPDAGPTLTKLWGPPPAMLGHSSPGLGEDRPSIVPMPI